MTIDEMREFVRDNPDHPDAFGSRDVLLLLAEIERFRSIISACHEALGEDAASDDDTLAEGVRLMREGHDSLRAEIDRLTKERDEARAKVAKALDLTTARADAHVVLFLIEKALTDGKE